MTAPVTRGFLFVGGWVDLDYEIWSAIIPPFIHLICPDYCWLMGNGIPVYNKGKRQGADADTASIPS